MPTSGALATVCPDSREPGEQPDPKAAHVVTVERAPDAQRATPKFSRADRPRRSAAPLTGARRPAGDGRPDYRLRVRLRVLLVLVDFFDDFLVDFEAVFDL